MPTKGYTINLASINKDDWEKVGGKAANLGELKRLGFLVPEGFVITTESYGQFLRENGLRETISNVMANTNFEDPSSIEKSSNELRKRFESWSYIAGALLILIPVIIILIAKRDFGNYGFILKEWRYNLNIGMKCFLIWIIRTFQ